MADLNLIAGFIFSVMSDIFDLYTGTWLLTGFLCLWLVRKVVKLFRHIQ